MENMVAVSFAEDIFAERTIRRNRGTLCRMHIAPEWFFADRYLAEGTFAGEIQTVVNLESFYFNPPHFCKSPQNSKI